MIRTHGDGTVDLFVKQGLGWEISLGCSSFDRLEPGTIEIGVFGVVGNRSVGAAFLDHVEESFVSEGAG